MSQKYGFFGFTPRIDVTSMSFRLEKYVPPHFPWVAASSAPAPLLPEQTPFGVPPLVIHPVSPCTTTFFRVLVSVLICTFTAGPADAASAAPVAATAMTIAPIRAMRVLRCMSATPFHEGCLACGRELVSWLTGLPAAPSRRVVLASGLCCSRRPRSQWRVR